MGNEQTNKWKVIAIIFIILFVAETLWIVWATYDYFLEDGKLKDCYYNFCSEYVDADYVEGVCTCYEYDLYGEYVVAKTKYG